MMKCVFYLFAVPIVCMMMLLDPAFRDQMIRIGRSICMLAISNENVQRMADGERNALMPERRKIRQKKNL